MFLAYLKDKKAFQSNSSCQQTWRGQIFSCFWVFLDLAGCCSELHSPVPVTARPGWSGRSRGLLVPCATWSLPSPMPEPAEVPISAICGGICSPSTRTGLDPVVRRLVSGLKRTTKCHAAGADPHPGLVSNAPILQHCLSDRGVLEPLWICCPQ